MDFKNIIFGLSKCLIEEEYDSEEFLLYYMYLEELILRNIKIGKGEM